MRNKFNLILLVAKQARYMEQNKKKLLYTHKKLKPISMQALENMLKNKHKQTFKNNTTT